MAGTTEGGKQAAQRNKERYGKDFYARIGAKGGKKSKGGFAAMPKWKVQEAGRKGGQKSKRPARKADQDDHDEEE